MTPEPAANSISEQRSRLPQLAVLLLLAVVVRGGALWALGGATGDPDGYRQMAASLAETGVYGHARSEGRAVPSAFRPPLYPLLIRWATLGNVTTAAIGVLHFMLGVATVYATWLLGRNWHARRVAFWGGVLVTFDPILLNQSAQVMTETLATFLAVVGLLSLTHLQQRRSVPAAALAGAALALAALCRPTFVLWLAAAALVTLAWKPFDRPRWHRLLLPLTMLATAAVLLLPWGLRNYHHADKLVLTTTHGGYTVLLGNNPHFYRHLRESRWGEVWDAVPLQEDLAVARKNYAERHGTPKPGVAAELQHDQIAYDLAKQHIRREPGMFVLASVTRVGRFWGLIPHQVNPDESWKRRLLRYGTGVWYAALFLAAIAGFWTIGRDLLRPGWLWAVLLALTFTAVHTVYWSNLRMRAPLMPAVCLLAAVGGMRFLGRKGSSANEGRHQIP